MDGSGVRYHPEWGNPITKEHTWYALTDEWILAQKLRIPKIQLAKHMKLKKKEDQSVDTLILLRRGNKISMEGVTETKCGAEIKGMAIQKLSHLGIHSLNNHQTQILIADANKCLLSGAWYTCLLRVSASAWLIQKWMLSVIHRMEHRVPNEGARESTQGAEGVCSPIGGTTIWTNQYPQSSLGLNYHQSKKTHGETHGSSCMCSRGWLSWPLMGGETLGPVKALCPSVGECQG